MVDVYCQNCGNITDELYQLPMDNDWLCLDCIIDKCDKASLSEWTEQDFENTGVQRVDEEAED